MSLKLAEHSITTNMVYSMMKNVTHPKQDGVLMLLLWSVMVKQMDRILGVLETLGDNGGVTKVTSTSKELTKLDYNLLVS